ncbi:MAG: hypothetical protein NC401_17780 [Ruminococcus sp.]|nr:hypothetical protein [Ruminococcus sp.]
MEKNYEWLVNKLRETEAERDEAMEHAEIVELDNLRLRVKLRAIAEFAQTIADYADDEPNIEDLFPDAEDYCPCTEEDTDRSGIPFA